MNIKLSDFVRGINDAESSAGANAVIMASNSKMSPVLIVTFLVLASYALSVVSLLIRHFWTSSPVKCLFSTVLRISCAQPRTRSKLGPRVALRRFFEFETEIFKIRIEIEIIFLKSNPGHFRVFCATPSACSSRESGAPR